MKGCLQLAARWGAGLVAVVFVLTLPLSVVAFNFGRVAFSPDRMTDLLTATIVETGGVRRLLFESLTAAPEPGSAEEGLDLAEALQFLSPQERDYLGEQLAPSGWGEEQLHTLVVGIYDWIENDRDGPSFTIDVTPLKVSLLGGGAAELVETMVDSWPPCSVEEAARMGIDRLLGQGDLILCEPPEPLRTGLVGVLNVSMAVSLRALPDRISLGGPEAERPAGPETMETKRQIRTLRFLAGSSWLLSILMLGLVLALAVRSWRSLGLWWGIPMLVGAGLTLVVMAGLRFALERALSQSLAGGGTPEWIAGLLRSLGEALLAVTFRRVALHSLGLLIAGAGILTGGLWLERRRRPSQAVAASEATTRILDEADSPEPPGPPPTGMFG